MASVRNEDGVSLIQPGKNYSNKWKFMNVITNIDTTDKRVNTHSDSLQLQQKSFKMWPKKQSQSRTVFHVTDKHSKRNDSNSKNTWHTRFLRKLLPNLWNTVNLGTGTGDFTSLRKSLVTPQNTTQCHLNLLEATRTSLCFGAAKVDATPTPL